MFSSYFRCIIIYMFELFITFAKIGVMTFGGGLAMLPVLERELADRKKWVDKDTLMDYYAIGQCTPGIIAVNVATFVGKKQKGILGGIAATLGIVFPSVVIITVLAAFFSSFAGSEIASGAFAGARAAVYVLVLNSLIGLCKKNIKNIWSAIIFAGVIVCKILFDISPVLLVLVCAVLGIVFSLRGGKK